MIASLILASCLVVKVHDGDTIEAKCPSRKRVLVLRVAEIDAPEYHAFTWGDQPGRVEAHNEAATLCLNREVTVKLDKFDPRTHRWIAHVNCQGTDLSIDEVSKGLAWSYLPAKGSKIPSLMAQAQAQKIGLWAQPGAIQPSVWRKNGMHQ